MYAKPLLKQLIYAKEFTAVAKTQFLASWKKISFKYALLSVVALLSLKSFATSTPKTFTYQGRFMNAAGTAPLTGNLTVITEIYEDAGTPDCLMFSERHSLTTSDGLFSILIGSGTRNSGYLTFPNDPSWDMKYIFDNSHVFSAANCPVQTLSANSLRKIRIHIYDGSTWTQLPDQLITAVPQAVVAETLQGREAIEFAQAWTTATRPANPVAGVLGFNSTENRMESWNGASWIQRTPKFGTNTKDNSATNNDVMRWDDSADEWVATSLGTLLGAAQGDLDGTWPNITVTGLDGNPVNTGTLAAGQSGRVLQWNGTQWVAAAMSNLTTTGVVAGDDNKVAKFTNSGTQVTDGSITDGATAVTFSKPLNMGTGLITNLATSTGVSTDAVNVSYLEGYVNPGSLANPFLKWNNSNNAWEPTTLTMADISDIGTMSAVEDGDADGQILVWKDADVEWKAMSTTGDVSLTSTFSGPPGSTAFTVNGLKSKALPTFSQDGEILYWSQTAGAWKKGPSPTADDQLLKWDNTAKAWILGTDDQGAPGGGITDLNGSTESTQSFAINTATGTAPAWSTNAGTGVHTLRIPLASAASVTAGLLSKTDYDRIPAAGTTAGQILRWSGTAWVVGSNVSVDASGNMTFSSNAIITGLPTPSNNSDAANKAYVDTAVGGLISDVTGGDGITATETSGVIDIDADVDNSTIELSASNGSGKIRVKDSGITAVKLATDAVETAKIKDKNVTLAKLADAAAKGQILQWSGTAWQLSDATVPTTTGQVLAWDTTLNSGNGGWKASSASGTTISGGTQNVLSKFNAAGTNVVDSQVTDNGTSGVSFANSKIQFAGSLFLHKGASGNNSLYMGLTTGGSASGDNNVAIGDDVMNNALFSGSSNTAVGKSAMSGITFGTTNTAIGKEALKSATTGSSNVAIGYNALSGATSSNNVAIGASALGGATLTASDNVSIGYNSGMNATGASSGNLFLGVNAGPAAAGAISNKLYIDNVQSNNPLILGDFANDTVQIHGDFILNTSGKYLSYFPGGTECAADDVLKWDDSNNRWICGTVSTAAGGITNLNGLTASTIDFAVSTSGTSAPNWSNPDTDTIRLNIPLASALSTGTDPGLITKAQYDRIPASGTTNDATMRWNGTAWVQTTGLKIDSSGNVVLAADPDANMEAVTKQYVDTAAGALPDGSGTQYAIARWSDSDTLGNSPLVTNSTNTLVQSTVNFELTGDKLLLPVSTGYPSLEFGTTGTGLWSSDGTNLAILVEGNENFYFDSGSFISNANIYMGDGPFFFRYPTMGSTAEATMTSLWGLGTDGRMWFNSDKSKLNMWVGAVRTIATEEWVTSMMSTGTTGRLPKWVNTTGSLTDSQITDNGTSGVSFGNSKLQFNGSLFAHQTAGTTNTFVGTSAANTTATGTQNTAVGYQSLTALTSGTSNVSIGYLAGGAASGTSSSNIFIGANSGPTSGAVSNKLFISNSATSTPLIGGDFSAGTLRFEGNVGIKGAANATYELDVNGEIEADAFLYSSDARLKENVVTLSGALAKILRLRGVEFDWIKNGRHEVGLIAQEVEQIYPDLVMTDDKGWKAVKYGNLVSPLVEATKELYGICEMSQKQISSLDSRITNVERKIASLEEQNRSLIKQNKKLTEDIAKIKRALNIKE